VFVNKAWPVRFTRRRVVWLPCQFQDAQPTARRCGYQLLWWSKVS